MKLKPAQLQAVAWSLSAVVVILAVVAWGQSYKWPFGNLSTYIVFPVLGLTAFSLMWTHYIMALLRMLHGYDRDVLHTYAEVTSFVVLICILLHPGLLSWQLWRDGLGLPPGSEWKFVGHSLQVAVTLGMISWFAFLAYELRHWFVKKNWWKYVQYASDIAILLIFYHALMLGSQIRHGWYRGVWWFYGITLVASLIYIYYSKLHVRPVAK